MNKTIKTLFTLIFCGILISVTYAQQCQLTVARLKYGGGGDWYTGPSMIPNLINAAKSRTDMPICDTGAVAEINDPEFFNFPFIFMTGHGEVRFTPEEKIRLRKYLLGGGFLWADDNYGMDKSFRREIAALFPENPLVKIPNDHPIYTSFYELDGLPKIHEHDGEPAQGYGVFFEGRMILFYTYSTDIGNGMEDLHVHNVGEKRHELALRMGVNVLYWYFDPH
ncbi:DUF4159 domain-containing protein [Chitinispirillales bacterium ANBcel5]|uniref:DUF4159 domain-containing protein n=1 Tax=Cellulosispirillum alkaliphilum TaxID=3039283 RepID=UPI002A566432|nr:DUF4159 domain-containing protein [Chitinispirillales bacterium ANBcel5]